MCLEKDCLSKIIKKEKKYKQTRFKRINIWIPSFKSFFIIFLLILPFGIIANLNLVYKLLYKINNTCSYSFLYKSQIWIKKFDPIDNYNNLISIHAGIGAVLIGLAFFVAQSLIDKNDPDKGRVLLYKSYFFPLLTAEILIFLMLAWGNVNIFAVIPIIILALFTIYFLGSTINILIKDHEMETAKKNMFFAILKNNFLKILDQEITKKIGRNELYKTSEIIEKDTNGLVTITPSFYDDGSKYISIIADKSGVVTDISFKDLEKFIAEIRKIGRRHKSKKYNLNTPETTKQSYPINKQDTIVFIRPQFLCHTSNISSELIKIKEDLFEEDHKTKDLENLKKLASKIFTIQKLPEIEKEASLEISKIKDRCLKAINNQETGELSKIVNFYIELTKEFFSYIDLYGTGVSSEHAEKESPYFFERLKPIEWLSRDIREIFEKGIQSKDINVIREVTYLPIRLANEAIENKNYLVFQEFIYFPELLYSYAYDQKNTNEKISSFMFDSTWRYLKELSDYNLESKLRNSKDNKKEFTNFAVIILGVFQNLIKASFDNKDEENFNLFIEKTNILFHKLTLGKRRNSIELEIFDELNKSKKEIFFTLSSWILFKLEDDKSLQRYFNKIIINVDTDIHDLTNTFLQLYNYDHWCHNKLSIWEKEGVYEETIQTIKAKEKLEKLYAVQSLKAIQSKNNQEIEDIELPHTRELAFLAEGTRDLQKILDDIKTNTDNWKFVFNNQIPKVDNFKKLLEKAKKAQDEADLQRKREATVSPKKVEEFKKNVVKNFYESHGIRNVLNYYGLVFDKSNEIYEGKIKKMGINTMFDKAPFFDESVKWHVHFMGDDNGFDFGRSLINRENIEIVEKIQKELTSINKDEFNKELANIDQSNIFIISLNEASWKFFEETKKSKDYIPKWQLKTNKYPDEIAGIYKFKDKKIPVYEIYDNSNSKAILVLNKKHLGKILQYSPLDKDDSIDLQQDIFYMDIGIFTDDSNSMQKFLDNPPDWLTKIGDEESQKNHLKERVIINIFERFEFQLDNNIQGFKIELDNT